MCQIIHFSACAGRCLLKNKEQNSKKKTFITLIFKIKALVIDNEAELDGDMEIKFQVNYVIIIWVDIRKIHTSKLMECLASIDIFQYYLA